LTCSYKF